MSSLRHAIQYHRAKTWHYQDRAGVSRTPTEHAEQHTTSTPYLTWIDRLWIRRQGRARRLASRPTISHLRLWLCIHSREGAWNANTGNGFYGGLQMTYGWDGLVTNAALLSPRAQMVAAETGYRRSSYSRAWLLGQWPGTAPPCLAYA